MHLTSPCLPAIKKFDRDLANQITRAGTSVILNLGEGRRRRGGDQRRSFDFAHGSASEVLAALDTADAWGWIVDARMSLTVAVDVMSP